MAIEVDKRKTEVGEVVLEQAGSNVAYWTILIFSDKGWSILNEADDIDEARIAFYDDELLKDIEWEQE